MQISVEPGAVSQAGDAVGRASARVAAVRLPEQAPDCGDVAATDAVRALLSVSGESLARLAASLGSAAVLLNVAADDYRRTEARLTAEAETR